MRKFHVRDFFDVPFDLWPCKENEKFDLTFDNNEVLTTNTARLEVSSHHWLVHKEYPNLPILPRHYINVGHIKYERIQNIMSTIYRDMFVFYPPGGFDREYVWRLLYKTSELLYNFSIVEYSKYVRGSNSFDFMLLYHHPPLEKIRKAMIPTAASVEKAQKAAAKILLTDPDISRNPVVSDLRGGLIKMEQLLQIILVRGNNTDIDSHIYTLPIMANYYAGIHDPAEAMMESTLAAKSIIFQGAPLEQTEYANRKMQFTSHQVDLLIMGDCGSDHLADIEIIRNESLDRFVDMIGLNYIDPESGELKALTEEDTHLIGQTLKFRLPFYCGYRDQNCVCATCYGTLAYNVPYGANIGHIASTMTQSEVSQLVLKIKHSESSTVSEPIYLSQAEKEFVRLGKDNPNLIFLQKEVHAKGISLLLRATEKDRAFNGTRLALVKKSDLQDGFSPAKHSQFREVTFSVPVKDKRPERYRVGVSRGVRMSALTMDFLRYFVKKSPRLGDDGFYHVDLSDWDFTKPVFELPNTHVNMKDFAAEVEVFIRSTRDDSDKHLGKLRQLRQYTDPVQALLDFHELVSAKVKIHFTHASIMLLSMMVPKSRENDFRIPSLDEPFEFVKYDTKINGLSLAPLFAYQGAPKELLDVDQYENVQRAAHLLDPIVMP